MVKKIQIFFNIYKIIFLSFIKKFVNIYKKKVKLTVFFLWSPSYDLRTQFLLLLFRTSQQRCITLISNFHFCNLLLWFLLCHQYFMCFSALHPLILKDFDWFYVFFLICFLHGWSQNQIKISLFFICVNEIVNFFVYS